MTADAEAFAIAAHGDQLYDSEPYRVHLAAVVRVLNDFGYVGAYEVAGWLHDVVEDTGVSLSEIADRFGPDVARMVDAVTGLGTTRAERNARIYAGIAQEPEAAAVKLADRIANVEAAAVGSTHAARYLSEETAFAAAVRPHVRWCWKTGQEAKLSRTRGMDDNEDDAEAVYGRVQGQGCAGGDPG